MAYLCVRAPQNCSRSGWKRLRWQVIAKEFLGILKVQAKSVDKGLEPCYYTPCQEKPPVCAGEPVTIAKRVHPFPSRTRKLSSSALTILWGQPHGKIGRRRFARPHVRFFVSSDILQNKRFFFRWCKRSSWSESTEVDRMLFKWCWKTSLSSIFNISGNDCFYEKGSDRSVH